MKYTLFIDEGHDEEVIVYAHSKNELIERLEALINGQNLNTPPIIGYVGDDIVEVKPKDVSCFFIEDKRLYASTEKGKVLFERIYLYRPVPTKIEGDVYTFECSANQALYYFERFSVSFGAALTVHFKNGYRDFVSRRQVKAVKERLGLK